MKSASNATLTEELLYDVVGGASPKPIIKTEYFSDSSSTWVDFDSDIENRSIQISTENKRYSTYSFMPPTLKMSMRLNNFGQVYSTGSGNAKASILKKNLLVRCWSGYEMPSAISETQTDDFTTAAKFVHTQKSGNTVINDISSYTGTVATAAQLGVFYGDTTYSGATYAYPGYYTKTFTTTEQEQPNNLAVVVATNKFSLRYRSSEYSNFLGASWNAFSTLATGPHHFTIQAPKSDKYFPYTYDSSQITSSNAFLSSS